MYLFVPYKYWNALGWLMHVSCLSVDILIFYKEPFGPVGTMAAQVFGFIPYYVITGKFDKSIGHKICFLSTVSFKICPFSSKIHNFRLIGKICTYIIQKLKTL